MLGVLTGGIFVASQSRIHRGKPDGVPRAASINPLKAESEGLNIANRMGFKATPGPEPGEL
jgi:hypothetical protein